MITTQGRIAGYFAICDYPEISFAKLVKYIKTSFNPVSNYLDFLFRTGYFIVRHIPLIEEAFVLSRPL